MNPEILGRLAAAAVIIGAGLLAFRVVNAGLLRRRTGAATPRGLESVRPGIPAILYFTTPDCAPCRTVQRPALAELQTRLGDGLQVVEVDCSRQPDLADYWGVLSVPTTFIIDAHGRPRHVNHGVTPAEKLLNQLLQIT
ncbi:MAG TPA: thioredoxin family protein [Anaerolineales bacterium]|nr:thioredoxin family protein [Anaerolineales bacterium]